MLTLLYFILILGLIVLVHEFGHFIFAKIFGVYVYEFSIGMGPKIIGTKEKKGKTTYNLRLLPIGGYVALAGEDPTEKDSRVPKGGYLYQKPIWQRFIIMVAGVFNNFVLAIILLFGIGVFYGSINMEPTVDKLDETYPMYEAGVREGDRFVSINGNHTSNRDDVQVYLALETDGDPVEFVMERDVEKLTFVVTPLEEKDEETEKTSYKYGLIFNNKVEHGIGKAIHFSFAKFGSYMKQIFITFKYLFTGRLSISNLSGPVGIYSAVGEVSKEMALLNLTNLTALLCVNVGFLNILPFPAFDGGRVLFLLIEKLRGKPVNPKIENTVNTVGFALLMLLVVFVTINDIIRLF